MFRERDQKLLLESNVFEAVGGREEPRNPASFFAHTCRAMFEVIDLDDLNILCSTESATNLSCGWLIDGDKAAVAFNDGMLRVFKLPAVLVQSQYTFHPLFPLNSNGLYLHA